MISKKKSIYTGISEYFQIATGILFASIGLKAFLLPNGFLDGGVTGIALLINSKFNINVSLLLVVLSIPFLVLAFYTVSKRIVLKSIISILGLAISIELETFGTITEDKLLISIFGGLFLGLGIGITIRNGAVLDGSEILGIFLNDRFGISIGQIILMFNVILFAITAAVISVEIALYSILTFVVTAKVTDFIIKGFEDFIGVMIVSKESVEIQKSIIQNLGAGMTIYQGQKGVGSNGSIADVLIIHTIINRIDIRKMNRIIKNIDEEAFVVEYDVNNIKGGVLRHYLTQDKRKKLPPTLEQMNENIEEINSIK
jgi:uncharacterized membrane-anchored protein YitT (DUF2179 family)